MKTTRALTIQLIAAACAWGILIFLTAIAQRNFLNTIVLPMCMAGLFAATAPLAAQISDLFSHRADRHAAA